jgi:hypothetical protein
MGKREEIAAQIAALQKQLEDDDDLELWVETEGDKGKHRAQLRGKYARKMLSRLGLDDDEDQADDDGATDGDGADGGTGDGGKDPAPPSEHKYFRRKG